MRMRLPNRVPRSPQCRGLWVVSRKAFASPSVGPSLARSGLGQKQPPNQVRSDGSFSPKQPSRPAPPAQFIVTLLGRCHVDTIEVMHANGRRVAQDYAAAVNWYPKARKAADQGSRRGPRLG
jgi:hypothetical protein